MNAYRRARSAKAYWSETASESEKTGNFLANAVSLGVLAVVVVVGVKGFDYASDALNKFGSSDGSLFEQTLEYEPVIMSGVVNYTIEAGDTLSAITNRLISENPHVSEQQIHDDLESLNPGTDSKLYVGQGIHLPNYAGTE